MQSITLRRIRRAIIHTRFRTDRKRNENGQSLWTVLGGLLLASLIIAFFVVPNLLGARNSTFNDAAENNLQASVASFKTYYSQNMSYSPLITPVVMKSYEPSLTFVINAASTDGKTIAFSPWPDAVIAAVYVQQTKNCYWMIDVEATTASPAAWTDRSGAAIGAGTFYNMTTGGTCASFPSSAYPTTMWNSNGFITN